MIGITVPTYFVLIWVFATPAEQTVIFANRFNKLECGSKAVELAEAVKGKRFKTTYSRFVCVPVTVPE